MIQCGLVILEWLAPGSLSVADSYHDIGRLYEKQGKLSEALEFYQKSLAIEEWLAPDSLDVAATYHNIGSVYKRYSWITRNSRST